MKLLKKEEPELIEIGKKYYHTFSEGVTFLYTAIKSLINDNLDTSILEQVIQCEHKCDRIKETYIQTLFREKRALPFLVEDRYKLIRYLDDIADVTEEIARFLKTYPFKLYEDLKDDLTQLNNNFKTSSSLLVEMVELMETDFNKAYKKSFNIETHKREARETRFRVLKILFQKKDDDLRVILTSQIFNQLFDIVQKTEEFSDYLRGLIIKYPTR